MRLSRSLIVGTLFVALSIPPALLASAATPSCFGKPATIVGIGKNDRLRGTSGADVIVGLGGEDIVAGRGGNDRLCGGGGRDTLRGGPGNDKMNGGPARDLCLQGPGSGQLRTCEATSFEPPPLPGFSALRVLAEGIGGATGMVQIPGGEDCQSAPTPGRECTPIAYPDDEEVVLTATNGSGSSTHVWLGDCAGVPPNALTCTVTMSQDRSVEVEFHA